MTSVCYKLVVNSWENFTFYSLLKYVKNNEELKIARTLPGIEPLS